MLSQSELLDDLHDQSDASAGDRLLLLGEFELCARRSNHRRAAEPIMFIEPQSQFPIASLQLPA